MVRGSRFETRDGAEVGGGWFGGVQQETGAKARMGKGHWVIGLKDESGGRQSTSWINRHSLDFVNCKKTVGDGKASECWGSGTDARQHARYTRGLRSCPRSVNKAEMSWLNHGKVWGFGGCGSERASLSLSVSDMIVVDIPFTLRSCTQPQLCTNRSAQRTPMKHSAAGGQAASVHAIYAPGSESCP